MTACSRTPVEIALTGVGICQCAHELVEHSSEDGCRACADKVDRPRLYRGEEARGRPRSPHRQQGR